MNSLLRPLPLDRFLLSAGRSLQPVVWTEPLRVPSARSFGRFASFFRRCSGFALRNGGTPPKPPGAALEAAPRSVTNRIFFRTMPADAGLPLRLRRVSFSEFSRCDRSSSSRRSRSRSRWTSSSRVRWFKPLGLSPWRRVCWRFHCRRSFGTSTPGNSRAAARTLKPRRVTRGCIGSRCSFRERRR